MKRVRRSKAMSIFLTLSMLLGMLPADMPGGAIEVQAAESSAAEYVTYTVGEWTASSDGTSESRTTTWDFTTNTPGSSIKIETGDTLKGIVSTAGTVTYKTFSSNNNSPQGLSLTENASVTVPLDSATTSVTLAFQLTSNNSARSITVGDSASESVSQNTSAEGAHIDSDKSYSGTYGSDYFTGAGLKLTAVAGESKFGYIKITETRAKSGEEGDEGGTEEITSWYFGNTIGFNTTVEGGTGTYNGLTIDATNGKLAAAGDAHAQFNQGTIIKVPVKGGCSITVTTTDAGAQYALYTINGTPASTTDKVTTVEYTGGAGTVDIVSTGAAYIKSIELVYPEGGSGDNTGDDASAGKKYLTLDGAEVTYDFRISSFGAYGKDESATWTHEDGILSIDGSISSNGTQHGANIFGGTVFSVNAPAGKTTITLGTCQYGSSSAALYVDGAQVGDAVSIGGLSADTLETVFTYTSEEAKTISIKITGGGYLHYMKAKSETPPLTYTLSGSITGLTADELAALSALSFTALTDSDYAVPAAVIDAEAGTYSIELAKGVAYKATALGVGNKIIETEIPAYEADTTLSLSFADAAVYKVTINKSSTPDLSGMNCEYVYTHEDGNVYSFTDISNISLRDGKYTFDIIGDFEKIPYKLTDGMSLTVNGAAASQVVKLEEVTTWSFNKTTGYNKEINGGTGYYQGLYIDATTGKLTARANDAQFNQGAVINVPVNGKCSISVTASSGPQYALYTINGGQASTTEMTSTVEYDGEAGTVPIVSTGSAYITEIKITYPAKEAEFVEQPAMPFVPADDTDANTGHDTDKVPRASKADSLVIQPDGQKLVLTQTGGAVSGAYNTISGLGYYVFPMTTDNNRLEFDIVIKAAGGTNGDGAFIGLFNNSYMYTLGIRKGTNPRAIYSKATEGNGDFAGAGGINNTITIGEPLHIVVEQADGKPTVTYTRLNTGEQASVALSVLADTETGYYYGLIVSDATVVISNMVYTAADGTVLYDQNSCYYPAGEAPSASNVAAVAASTREYIDVAWDGSIPEKDGTYVVEMQKDGGSWVELASDITTLTYRYALPEGDGGSYLFRVCGQLGNKNLGGTRNDYAVMTEPISVVAALAKPVVTISGNAADISLVWEPVAGAESYEIYRYSYDEGVAGRTLLAAVTTASYTDTGVEAEVPYYYEVKALSSSNYSPMSETVWAVPTAGHKGDYVYENEATEIFITKKSYDTVFSDKAVLEGIVYGNGTIKAEVNGKEAAAKSIEEGGSFAFELTLEQGRNDVNLLFTDSAGKTTRKTYNFVYLTNYDIVVDASYTGVDGEMNADGIPVYRTVQAAVDSVPASNADSIVILVMEGEYEERLVVDKPYVSIIGEDRESTLIHFYPGVLGEKYEAGGDMDKRCAIYITGDAVGFSAENISFANDYVYSTPDNKSNKSADAIRVEATGSVFVNTKITGVQDTLYMHKGNQYYYKCRIEGLVDFIYSGDEARAFFNDCEIVFVYESTKTSGYVCAPKTAASAAYGLTFYNCVVYGEEGCNGNGYLLARPWGVDAYVTWINCYMGRSIYKTMPYASMTGAPEDARFFEYGTYGPAFEINADRRQISPSKAAEMVSDKYLGWSPAVTAEGISTDHYKGSVKTTAEEKFVTAVPEDDKYLQSDGDDTGLAQYREEGFAAAYGVTGGGLLKENSSNYYKASTGKEFLDALLSIKESGRNSVIELTADINLGCNEIDSFSSYSKVIKAYSAQALTHPTLIESGVSTLTFDGVHNLTIFSQNGSSIKHANITMKNSSNIIIRNIKFDELWEWDDATGGDYDRNDWDYMTIDSATTGVWIDHCTFYKAYDGIIDVKNPAPTAYVTISWCEFLPGSEDNVFFDVMMNELEKNPQNYPTYAHMLEEGMTKEQIYSYAYGQKKTHLFGQADESTNAEGIRVTLANNYYKNSMDRMPRLRYGVSHVYNCIMDAQDLLDVRLSITNEDMAMKIVSNGAASTCGAQVLLENCYISGIQNALNSGNGSSPSGYINAVNSVYYMDNVLTRLEPKSNSTTDSRVLVTDADSFVAGLPYSGYTLYDADALYVKVRPYAGAGRLSLTVLQWEKSGYNDTYTAEDTDEKVITNPDTMAKEDVDIPDTVVFIDSEGNKVSSDKVILVKYEVKENPDAAVVDKVRDIIKNVKAEDVKVMYYDIRAYIEHSEDKEVTIQSGSVKVRMEYPEGSSVKDKVIVLHGAKEVTVEKHEGYFTFEADGFSPYTVIVIKSDSSGETSSESESTENASSEGQPESSGESQTNSGDSGEYYSPGTGAVSPVLSVCIVLLILSVSAFLVFAYKNRKKMTI